jgi:hypothetical protein
MTEYDELRKKYFKEYHNSRPKPHDKPERSVVKPNAYMLRREKRMKQLDEFITERVMKGDTIIPTMDAVEAMGYNRTEKCANRARVLVKSETGKRLRDYILERIVAYQAQQIMAGTPIKDIPGLHRSDGPLRFRAVFGVNPGEFKKQVLS